MNKIYLAYQDKKSRATFSINLYKEILLAFDGKNPPISVNISEKQYEINLITINNVLSFEPKGHNIEFKEPKTDFIYLFYQDFQDNIKVNRLIIIERDDIRYDILKLLIEVKGSYMKNSESKKVYVSENDTELMNLVKIFISELSSFSKNTLLYGPPGTGKTYHSLRLSSLIAEKSKSRIHDNNASSFIKKDPLLYKDIIKTSLRNNDIIFTTFHQSISYEDFIEGIKPRIDNNNLVYLVIDGLFKKLCAIGLAYHFKINWIEFNKIKYYIDDMLKEIMNKDKFDVYSHLKIIIKVLVEQHDKLRDNEFQDSTTPSNEEEQLSNEEEQLSNEEEQLSNEGEQPSNEEEQLSNEEEQLSNEEEQLSNEGEQPSNDEDQPSNEEVQPFTDVSKFTKKKKSFNYDDITYECGNDLQTKNLVFIIDEINRGNVSQIFGELITLIEEDKRYGAKNAISVTLPYSGESFIVPPNLYIIGTMNTADRSVEALDTALRRRFVFKEMKPDYSLLENVIVDKIYISKILRIMNEKISEIKCSRDYEIGHAYFWPLKEDLSLDKLKSIFANSILPLLKEYFYGDYSSIKDILNEKDNNNDPVVLEVTKDFYDVRIERIYDKDADYFKRIYSVT